MRRRGNDRRSGKCLSEAHQGSGSNSCAGRKSIAAVRAGHRRAHVLPGSRQVSAAGLHYSVLSWMCEIPGRRTSFHFPNSSLALISNNPTKLHGILRVEATGPVMLPVDTQGRGILAARRAGSDCNGRCMRLATDFAGPRPSRSNCVSNRPPTADSFVERHYYL